MPLHILLGCLRGEYIALLTFVRIVPALWKSDLFAKHTVAPDVVTNSSIFLSTFDRVWFLPFDRNPGDLFYVEVSLFRLITIILLLVG